MSKFFLTRREEFRAVARRGRRKTGVFWSLRYKPAKTANADDEQPAARFAVSVSKRHLRRASKRNRLRRVLRESFRQIWAGELFACDYLLASASRFTKNGKGGKTGKHNESSESELREECLRLLTDASGIMTRKRHRHLRQTKAA